MKRIVRVILRIGAAIYFWLTVGCTKEVQRVEVVTHNQVDTVMMRDTLSAYSSPTDSSLVYLVFDTVPGFALDSIVIRDIQTGFEKVYQPEFFLENYVIHPLTPMLCEIRFYYEWTEPDPPIFSPTISMFTFNYDHSWTAQVGNHSPHDGVHEAVAVFSPIDISKIFTIKFQNHAD